MFTQSNKQLQELHHDINWWNSCFFADLWEFFSQFFWFLVLFLRLNSVSVNDLILLFDEHIIVIVGITTINMTIIIAPPPSSTSQPNNLAKYKYVDCERQCPYYYYPICATNGIDAENRMFVNVCEMQAWNCDVKRSKYCHS